MTRLSLAMWSLAATLVVGATAVEPVRAQCSTCGTQTVFSPVIAQPQQVVAFSPVVSTPVMSTPVVVAQPARTGWYPGRMLDNMRMNHWARHSGWGTTAVPVGVPTVQTVNFAPTPVVQTVGFAPTATVQTVNFAPSASFVTPFAPMQRTVVGFAPMATTVFSPAVIEPVMTASPCSSCAAAAPCSACAGGTTVVEQAAYTSPVTTVVPESGCSSCAAATTSVPAVQYVTPGSVPTPAGPPPSAISAGPETPQPSLAPNEGAPAAGSQNYGAQYPGTKVDGTTNGTPAATPEAKTEAEKSVIEPKPMGDADPAGDSATFQAPPLLGPQNNPTANRPTVDIHDAVYRQPARKANVNTTTVAKPATPVSTGSAPQTDAYGWYPVAE
ncbi:hypothetical protein [Lacipirellula parvula]|uniref:Uncharacterized protein n=1 Tax=Lacipirellula parvula TaxID=2650471 RepID=A0A5K7X9I8_9BACT|nr:hypothetical protein [Lacipirellula parvula]BBO33035.1 hypothetical protein PLANPX_2647 [Lacipirellula parvula]